MKLFSEVCHRIDRLRLRWIERRLETAEERLAWIRDQRCPLSEGAIPALSANIIKLQRERTALRATRPCE